MSGSRPSSFTLTSPGPLRLYSMTELLRLPPPTWLIDTIVPAGGLVGLYGPPGSFKSFLAIDMAMAVATGRAWHGQGVARGHVIYVAAEGGTGIAKRAHAWLDYYKVHPTQAEISWLVESLVVNPDGDQMDQLFGRIHQEINREPSLVVIDTLARCFEGDENTQEDMGRFVAGVDRLRREFQSTVVVVHHTRLGGDRERGNTAFRGAADAMISIERTDDDVIISNNKQKDSQEFLDRMLTLKAVPERDSVVFIEPQTARNEAIRRIVRSRDEGISFSNLATEAAHEEISRPALKRRLVSLVKNNEIIKENGLYRINEAQSDEG